MTNIDITAFKPIYTKYAMPVSLELRIKVETQFTYHWGEAEFFLGIGMMPVLQKTNYAPGTNFIAAAVVKG